MKMLHITKGQAGCLEPDYFRRKIEAFGILTVIREGQKLSPAEIAARVRDCDVYLAGWESVTLPVELAADRGRLQYICGVTGTMREFVPVELVDAGIPLTNWGDSPANQVAEGAMTLLLATIKSLHQRIQWTRDGKFGGLPPETGGSLDGLSVGVYGCGVIGRRFVEMLRPFGSTIRIFDPYLKDVPQGCTQVASLRELFSQSEAIVIHAGLTDETRRSVTAELLSLLPNGAAFINTARGGIVDQEALFAELENGRLRAGLDVLEPDRLAADHPARQWQNLILTCHAIEHGAPFDPARPKLRPFQQTCLENLSRFAAGRPLLHIMDSVRYRRST